MMGHRTIIEDKPYITHNKSHVAFVTMDFSEFYPYLFTDDELSRLFLL